VDPSLQASLIGGLKDPTLDAVLDLGTRASGKLTLLDEILSELRNKGLKVLILFQVLQSDFYDPFLPVDSLGRTHLLCISWLLRAWLGDGRF